MAEGRRLFQWKRYGCGKLLNGGMPFHHPEEAAWLPRLLSGRKAHPVENGLADANVVNQPDAASPSRPVQHCQLRRAALKSRCRPPLTLTPGAFYLARAIHCW